MNFLGILLFVLITLITYNLLKIFVLSNIRANKFRWLILILGIIICVASLFLKVPTFVMYIIQWLYLVLILWSVDLFVDVKREKIKNKNIKVVKNKPKVKPNRIKHKN
ncbi:hypothetical protein [Candidatus Arthromitus sp. SFB-rat-Yit]|uniref:hypothetical protein n=1 Tax=Candidatus Arthromitus sp. SFB-rat-Yit TaxID=1041504 RepID=UPI000227A50F|nr:hypothetical protein [Candidatus Arthromitus sp. SFB-rat-Yit]BAK81600.1 hypothetical protein RATSFB_1038 [Candidatus Arthromitus sp. SFB-rat-Yit]